MPKTSEEILSLSHCKLCGYSAESQNEVLDHIVIMHTAEMEKIFFSEGKYEMIFVLREYKGRTIFK